MIGAVPRPSPGLLRNPTSPRAERGEVEGPFGGAFLTSPRSLRGEVGLRSNPGEGPGIEPARIIELSGRVSRIC
jgi:hypothetical protein